MRVIRCGMRRSWIALGLGLPLAVAGLYALSRRGAPAGDAGTPTIAKLFASGAAAPAPASLAGLDITNISMADNVATAPLPSKRTARLTLDTNLQNAALGVLESHHIPEAAVVLMDVETGRVLVYANHVEEGSPRDLCAEATAPSASVFKIITGSALLEAGVTPSHKECYSGGEQRIHTRDLVSDPKRDRWCTTLTGAMGRSINTIFARLALRHLKPKGLEGTARTLGYGAPLPFDLPVQPSGLKIPEDSLGFARTSAGFWNTTLSPIHAAWLSATIARGGEPVRPVLVSDVVSSSGKVEHTATMGVSQKRVLKPEVAKSLTEMLDDTVLEGTSYRAFHDGRGKAFLPGVSVAGKTGTLSNANAKRHYTWFTGFAPSHPYMPPQSADGAAPMVNAPRQVAIAVLVVNKPTWQVKANVVAREVLRAYFAGYNLPGVSPPSARRVSDRRDPPTAKNR